MKSKLLLPYQYKSIGWILLIPSCIAGLFLLAFDGIDAIKLPAKVFVIYSNPVFGDDRFFNIAEENVTSTLVGVLFILGGLLVAFSREKNEDEYISSIRLSSWQWAVLVNYGLLLISFLFIYGTAFLMVMVYNMFTVLILFIARYNYLLYRNAKLLKDEKHD